MQNSDHNYLMSWSKQNVEQKFLIRPDLFGDLED